MENNKSRIYAAHGHASSGEITFFTSTINISTIHTKLQVFQVSAFSTRDLHRRREVICEIIKNRNVSRGWKGYQREEMYENKKVYFLILSTLR